MGSGLDAASIDAAIGSDSRTFDVHVSDASGSGSAGIAGARVCVVAQTDCEVTDAHGDATVTVLGMPYDLSFALEVTANGYLSTVELGRVYAQLDVSVYTVPTDIALLPTTDAQSLFAAAGFSYPASTGYVRMVVKDGVSLGGEAGATITLAGSGSAVYLDATGRPDPALTAIGSGGGALLGGVPPGPITLTVNAANKACVVQALGWDGSGSAAMTGVAAAGALTDAVVLACYNTH